MCRLFLSRNIEGGATAQVFGACALGSEPRRAVLSELGGVAQRTYEFTQDMGKMALVGRFAAAQQLFKACFGCFAAWGAAALAIPPPGPTE
jgi:hypothetical protein